MNVKENIRIIGIDPGSHLLGMSVFDIDNKNKSLQSVYATTLIIDNLPTTLFAEINDDINNRLARLKTSMINSFNYYLPDIIVCETPFINPKRPAAYGILIKVFYTLEEAIKEYDENVLFLKYSPSIIKKKNYAGAHASKDMVRLSILNNQEIINKATIDLNSLNPDAIDSIAIANTAYIELKENNIWS